VKPVEAKQLVELLATGLSRSTAPASDSGHTGKNGQNGNGH